MGTDDDDALVLGPPDPGGPSPVPGMSQLEYDEKAFAILRWERLSGHEKLLAIEAGVRHVHRTARQARLFAAQRRREG